ncbi:hypothetical protein I3842_05G201300 [Carya illinoinensis]|uniref:Uncharacterized protein n=1 Tax=Carya illinoinensis TaxID=32201 RepID=A0A922JNI7_CARIL|nr:hypothetical protein I3842_05G201300 [Carya illinoinensis]
MDLKICDFCLQKKENITSIGLKIVVISTPCLFAFQLLTHCDKQIIGSYVCGEGVLLFCHHVCCLYCICNSQSPLQ